MAWTLHFLVWITVMTASAYKCKHPSYSSSGSDTGHQHDYTNQEPLGILDNHAYERMSTRSADISPASYSSNVPDDVMSAQLRLGQSTATRTENESKVLSWKHNAQSRRGENSDSSKIVFPGPTSEEFQLEIPEHCKRLGICEDIPNYPTEQVNKVLSELSDLDMLPDDKPDLPDVPDIAQRVGPEEQNIELCTFEEKLMYPQAAVDAKGNWHVVLQAKNPTQGFKVEICKDESKIDEWQTSEIREGKWQDASNCSNIAIFVSGYEGRCKQKFVYRKMSVLQNGTRLESRSLKVPSCCSCVARTVTN